MTPVVIYPSRLRVSLLLLGAALFVAGGIWLLMHPIGGDEVMGWLIGWASIVFFGAVAVFALSRLVSRKPAITIDRTGITDNASGLSAGFIPWSDVVDAQVIKFQQQKFLGVSLRNPKDYLAKASPLKRMLMKANSSLVGFVINVPQISLPVPLEEVLAHIDRFRRADADAPHI
ncbi:hypothetical protein NU688_26675 [Variovorax sp. ZS18.2.2]|uniref:STM3941 family protein n=1 Tax=Variovorax sp. ZS18.2.2 TaxID=2971255 RepID=UPI0021517DCE|nr:STM3941 family protein [Variovorax sp. ZS18.2.2]MCR6479769.1 hypothetical protein [Variovorax sp. ZS18.2.2]